MQLFFISPHCFIDVTVKWYVLDGPLYIFPPEVRPSILTDLYIFICFPRPCLANRFNRSIHNVHIKDDTLISNKFQKGALDQVGSLLMSFCKLWISNGLSIVRQIFTSFANVTASHQRPFKQSFMYSQKRTGPSRDPCGTPLVTSINLKYASPTLTRSVLLVRKLRIQL